MYPKTFVDLPSPDTTKAKGCIRHKIDGEIFAWLDISMILEGSK